MSKEENACNEGDGNGKIYNSCKENYAFFLEMA